MQDQTEEVDMRKVVASEFVSLDGVMGSPEQWHFQYLNDEMQEVNEAIFAAADAIMIGRVTYEEWVPFWPSQGSDEGSVAGFMNNTPKYVVSTTLEEPLEWNNSSLIKENLAEEITKLKRQPGKDISISGSAALVQSLLRDGLLDELRLMVHPIVVGTGKRLFENGELRKAWSWWIRGSSVRGSSTSSTGRQASKAHPSRAVAGASTLNKNATQLYNCI